MNLIGFDFETAGRDPLVHPPLQFGGVVVNEAWQEIDKLEFKIKLPAGAPVEAEALKMANYSAENWATALEPKEAANVIAGFLSAHAGYVGFSKSRGRNMKFSRLTGFNVLQFDVPVLARLFGQFGIEPMWHHHVLDVYALAQWRYLGALQRPISLSLTSLLFYAEHGRDPQEGELARTYPNAHGALADTRMSLRLAHRMTEELRLEIFAPPPDAIEVL